MQGNTKAMRHLKAYSSALYGLFLCTAFFLVVPGSAFAETIHSFVSDITLKSDGSFLVEETIVYDFESEERHGIFRDIEKKHAQGSGSFWKERTIDIDVRGVAMDGEEAPYEVSEESGNVRIKIGDRYATVTGIHTYAITYEVEGGLSYFEEEGAELYWNITGNAWEVPIAKAQANLHGDAAFFMDDSACYKGAVGTGTACDEILEYENVVQFSAFNLGPYEGLTIGQELNSEVLSVLVVEHYNWAIFAFIGIPFLILGLIIFGYRYRTYFKTGAPIIAQYEPYKNFKPMYAGVLLDGKLDPRDITAGIVYLAQQGFIKIKKIDKKVLFFFEVDDYQIELVREVSLIGNSFLEDIARLLFSNEQDPQQVTLSSLKSDLSKQKSNYALLQELRKDLKKDMRENGFYQVHTELLKPLFILGILLFVLVFFIDAASVAFAPVLLLLLFVGLGGAAIVFFIMYERRTRLGYEAQDHLKGFKLFLSVTDEERFKFHNAPQKSPEQFMQYLPYAIAFGVEKQWAKAFEGITIPNPDWYEGGSSSFSAVNLTSSLGAFSTSFAASSGSSGSSGGGSSGGGGGGGGGGSW